MAFAIMYAGTGGGKLLVSLQTVHSPFKKEVINITPGNANSVPIRVFLSEIFAHIVIKLDPPSDMFDCCTR